MVWRNGKVQDNKFKSFSTKYLKFLSTYFQENANGNFSPNDFLLLSNLKNAKKKYYPDKLNLIS